MSKHMELGMGALTVYSTPGSEHDVPKLYHWEETVTQHQFGPFKSIESCLRHYMMIKEQDREDARTLIQKFVVKYAHLNDPHKHDVIFVDFRNKRRRLSEEEMF